jgi:hypothetical protein
MVKNIHNPRIILDVPLPFSQKLNESLGHKKKLPDEANKSPTFETSETLPGKPELRRKQLRETLPENLYT